jgi:hypothetical protein
MSCDKNNPTTSVGFSLRAFAVLALFTTAIAPFGAGQSNCIEYAPIGYFGPASQNYYSSSQILSPIPYTGTTVITDYEHGTTTTTTYTSTISDNLGLAASEAFDGGFSGYEDPSLMAKIFTLCDGVSQSPAPSASYTDNSGVALGYGVTIYSASVSGSALTETIAFFEPLGTSTYVTYGVTCTNNTTIDNSSITHTYDIASGAWTGQYTLQNTWTISCTDGTSYMENIQYQGSGSGVLPLQQTGGSPPLQINPPSQLSIGAGLPYQGTFTATGGTGDGYTWCVLSGSGCDPTPAAPAALPSGFTLSQGGVLSCCTPGSQIASVNTYPFTVQVTDSGGNVASQQLSFSVLCQVSVYPVPIGQSGTGSPMAIFANFAPPNTVTGGTLSGYALACGFSAFDWQQYVTLWTPSQSQLSLDFFAQNNQTVPLSAPPQFSDPPLGGYTYQFYAGTSDPLPVWKAVQPNFATAYPYYYSPLDLTSGCAVSDLETDACIAYIESAAQNVGINAQTELNFYDLPNNPLCNPNAPCLAFRTQLVGVCTAPSPSCNATGPSLPLSQWVWTSNLSCLTTPCSPVSSTGEISISTANIYMPPVGSGSGGVAIASINGVPSPAISVVPSAGPIYAVEPLSVGITVSQFQGQPEPAGTVTLTSGTYASAAATLDNGTANITIPTGSLSLGSDMLLAVYTPATPVSATYSQGWGTALVTVNPALPQIVFVPTPGSQTYGTPITATSLDATAQYNGNPVSGTFVYTTGACSGGGQVLTAGASVLQAGSYSITACFTPLNADFTATNGTVQYLVNPASQSITFRPIMSQLVGQTISLNATATSGLAVAFQSLTPMVCSVSQTMATMLSLGTCTIEATQNGNVDYNAANPVEVSFSVMGFTLTVEPSSETIRRGVLGVFLLEVKSVNGFSGNVSISCSGGPPDSVCKDLPQTVKVTANGTALALAGILFQPQCEPDTYTITFAGVSSTDVSTATATFTVK